MKSKESIRLLCIIGVIAFFALAWYVMLDKYGQKTRQYNSYLNTAREKKERAFYEDARDNYEAALRMKDSIELRKEILDFQYNSKRTDAYIAFCEETIKAFPHEALGYVRLAQQYYDSGTYRGCADVIRRAERRGVQAEDLGAIYNNIKYKYEEIGKGYSDVKPYVGELCQAQNSEGMWGYLDEKGSTKLSFKYLAATDYNGQYMVVKNEEGKVSIIDLTGREKSDDPEKRAIDECLFFHEDKFPVKYNGKYYYYNFDFKELFGGYEYAGAYNFGVAAVKKDGKWMLIDGNGKQVGSNTYDDIKLDEKGIAFRNGRAFVKMDNMYYMVDTNGNKITSDGWADADVFRGDQPAAVSNGKQWGYVNADGKMTSEFQFNNAKSFSNGFAPVAEFDKWGYITIDDYSVVIEMKYDDAIDFNGVGRAFVKSSNGWNMIHLYIYD